MKTNNADISFEPFQKEKSLPERSCWLLSSICAERWAFSDWVDGPRCSCATLHSPFCCRDSLVGHTPISYSLSFVIHSRTFHLAFLIAPCSAVVSGNAWLYSLLNQAGVVLAIQGTSHQRKKSNCCWAIVFHFISHTQKSSGDHPVGALKYRFQDTFLS